MEPTRVIIVHVEVPADLLDEFLTAVAAMPNAAATAKTWIELERIPAPVDF